MENRDGWPRFRIQRINGDWYSMREIEPLVLEAPKLTRFKDSADAQFVVSDLKLQNNGRCIVQVDL